MNEPESARNGLIDSNLSPKQEAAALALAAGRTLIEAASDSGAGEAKRPATRSTRGAESNRSLHRLDPHAVPGLGCSEMEEVLEPDEGNAPLASWPKSPLWPAATGPNQKSGSS